MKRIRSFVVLLAGILGVFVLLQYVLTNRLAIRGGDLSRLLIEEQTLREEHQKLLVEIAKFSAVTRVRSEAKYKGFIKPDRFLSLNRTGLALRHVYTR